MNHGLSVDSFVNRDAPQDITNSEKSHLRTKGPCDPLVGNWCANALNWHPTNVYVQAIALELGLTDEQVGGSFNAAALKN